MKLHANACNVFFKRGYKKCFVFVGFNNIINYHTRMATIHYQEVKTEGLLTCPLICYKYSAILSDGRWIHQNFLVWKRKEKNTMTFKNHANQVSKIQNEKDRKLLKSWYCKCIVTILINICMPFGNVLILAEAAIPQKH